MRQRHNLVFCQSGDFRYHGRVKAFGEHVENEKSFFSFATFGKAFLTALFTTFLATFLATLTFSRDLDLTLYVQWYYCSLKITVTSG